MPTLGRRGPIWYQNKLFYVEYGRGTVTTWDGKRNEVFWKQDGCNPVGRVADGQRRIRCHLLRQQHESERSRWVGNSSRSSLSNVARRSSAGHPAAIDYRVDAGDIG